MNLRRKLQEIIALCNSALWNEDSVVITSDNVVNSKINIKIFSDEIRTIGIATLQKREGE